MSSTSVRRAAGSPLRRVALAATILLVAALLPAASASAAAGRPIKPTIVLVHGAWADGSSWSGVAQRMLRDGYQVRIPPNPLHSLAGDSATVAAFLSTVPGSIVLVGHSYGGAVITNAATGNPNIKALVYVDAFLPLQGETIFPLAGAYSALAAPPETLFDFVPNPGGPAGDVDLYLKQSVFRTSFANQVRPQTVDLLYAAQRPFALSAGSQPSGAPAWATIPSWGLIGVHELVIPAAQQRLMARRAGARIGTVNGGHLVFVSQPGVMACHGGCGCG